MALELIAAIALALGTAGIVILLRKLSGGRIPKIMLPASVAIALVSFAVWGDYSWSARTVAAMPERVSLVETVSHSNAWRPWTYAFPVTERFVAADMGGLRRNGETPDLVLVDLLFIERRMDTRRQPVLVNCRKAETALVSGGGDLDPTRLGSLDWTPLPARNRLNDMVCS